MQVSVNSATTYLTRLFITIRSVAADFGSVPNASGLVVNVCSGLGQRLYRSSQSWLDGFGRASRHLKKNIRSVHVCCCEEEHQARSRRQRRITDGRNCLAHPSTPDADAQSSSAVSLPQRKDTINLDRAIRTRGFASIGRCGADGTAVAEGVAKSRTAEVFHARRKITRTHN